MLRTLERLASWRQRQRRRFLPEADDECRGWIRHVTNVSSSCQPAAFPETDPLPARVRDISIIGLSLIVSLRFEPGTLLSIELPGLSGQAPYATLARVVHVTELLKGEWILGCHFADELSEEDLQWHGAERKLAPSSDQRNWVRFPCDTEATFSIITARQPDDREGAVINISPNGLGLRVSRPVEVGAVLSVGLENQLQVLACVVHVTLESPGSWVLGCTLIRELAEPELQNLVKKV